MHVRAHFCNPEWVATHIDKTINEVVVTYASTAEIHATRPAVEHVYDSLVGMKSSFMYMALSAGVVARRAFGCWCPACLRQGYSCGQDALWGIE